MKIKNLKNGAIKVTFKVAKHILTICGTPTDIWLQTGVHTVIKY